MFLFIAQATFLHGVVIMQKLITLKLCVPKNISQHCLGANVVRQRSHILLVDSDEHYLISYMQPQEN